MSLPLEHGEPYDAAHLQRLATSTLTAREKQREAIFVRAPPRQFQRPHVLSVSLGTYVCDHTSCVCPSRHCTAFVILHRPDNVLKSVPPHFLIHRLGPVFLLTPSSAFSPSVQDWHSYDVMHLFKGLILVLSTVLSAANVQGKFALQCIQPA